LSLFVLLEITQFKGNWYISSFQVWCRWLTADQPTAKAAKLEDRNSILILRTSLATSKVR